MATMQTSLGTVSYTDEGSGPPIVLLHAALHDRTDFAPVTEALGKGRRVWLSTGQVTASLPCPPPHCAPSSWAISSSSSPTDWT